MKKIYLLTLALTALMLNTMGQACPSSGPTAYYAINYTFTGNPPHNVIKVGNLPASQPGHSWAILLVRHPLQGGGYIPEYNKPGDFEVEVNPTSGTADFPYSNTETVVEVVVRHFDGTNFTFCQITNIGQGGPLPVQLTSFTGRLKNDNEVTLDWASSMELENSKYEVERSADGKYFEKIGTLNGAGSTYQVSKYTYTDRLPGSGAYFYRLKQIDLDGKFEYSKVVYVNSKKGSGIVTKVFPNPFKGEVQLIGATSSDLTPNNVKVFSISGQRVTYRFMGANSILIDPSAPDGVYILQVKDQRFKLVKNPSGTGY